MLCFLFNSLFFITFPIWWASANKRISQILTCASIFASCIIAVAVFKSATFSFPSIPAFTFVICCQVCATSVITTGIWIAFVGVWNRELTTNSLNMCYIRTYMTQISFPAFLADASECVYFIHASSPVFTAIYFAVIDV